MRIRDLMTKDVITVREDTPLKEAAQLMAGHGVSGLPVVDEEGRVVGILTEADFVDRAGAKARAGLVDALFDRTSRRLAGDSVGAAMTHNVVTIEPDVSHAYAARIMQKRKVKRLPVAEEDGRLVGVVSRSDILGVFARPDDEITHDIRDRIIGQVLALEPDSVTVEVEDGRVELSGTVPSKTEARLLEDLSTGVDGVMHVESNVRYRVDDTKPANEPRPYGVPRPNW